MLSGLRERMGAECKLMRTGRGKCDMDGERISAFGKYV